MLSSLNDDHFVLAVEIFVPLGHIAPEELTQLGGELNRGWPAANDNESEESFALALRNERTGGPLKALDDPVPDGPSLFKLFEEEDVVSVCPCS